MTNQPGRDDVHEVKTHWFKSSFSGGHDCCVEITFDDGGVLVRDSKFKRDPLNDVEAEPILSFTDAEWTAFIAGAKAGEFDRTETGAR